MGECSTASRQYTEPGIGSHLQRLLGVFEEVLFRSDGPDCQASSNRSMPFPASFHHRESSRDMALQNKARLRGRRTRCLPVARHLGAFTPHAPFPPENSSESSFPVSHPLYSKRGTRDYLEQLLKLCFPEIHEVEIDDNPVPGFIIGQAKVGKDTLIWG